MKKILTVLVFLGLSCFYNHLQADSLVGGDISYTYIGDSTGIPNQYLVDVSIHFTAFGAWPSTNLPPPQVCVQSSCFPGFSVGSSLHPAMPNFSMLIGNTECLRVFDQNYLPTLRVMFQAMVTLPDTCSDIRFSVQHCCRLPANQLANYTQNTDSLFLQATLNNTLENRRAPRFLANPYAMSYCRQGVVHGQGVDNFANDSLVFRLVPLRKGACHDSILPADLMFASGYSDSIPFAVQAGSQLEVFPSGMFSFLPASVNGNFAFGMEWDIYSQVPGSPGDYYLFGTIHREEVISIGSQCELRLPSFPPSSHYYLELIPTSVLRMLPFSAQIPNTDSLADTSASSGFSMQWLVYEYGCDDTIPMFLFGNNNVACPTISPDGSEFIVYGPDSTQVPVVSSQGVCNSFDFTDRVNYAFPSRLPFQDDYYVTIVEGTDGNTFINHCGYELTEYYTFVLRNTCPTGFSVVSPDDESPIQLYPNPNHGNFTLKASGRAYHRASLMDLRGRMLFQKELSNENSHQFNLENIASGQYILWLINDETGSRGRIKVQIH
ncbi:MAG: T9SS type A sorting domain-containing protein [Cryomorphaceae bacterium]|nr:T9SS type A sorting domain-containing protein [Cryomorphaceae bacterium]